jgi:hypothetical protein
LTDARRIWDTVCRHIDGVAIGSTMAALHSRDALGLLGSGSAVRFGVLCEELGANAGFLNVAIRLLATQGWVRCAGEPGTDELTIAPTPAGRAVLTEYAGAYATAVGAMAGAGAGADLIRAEWGLPAGSHGAARAQVLAQLDGHLVTPVMAALGRDGADGAAAMAGLRRDGVDGAAVGVLRAVGWAGPDGEPTGAGRVALSMAAQYRYPLVYLPLLRGVPELLFGDPSAVLAGTAHTEVHLDREQDIAFSGDVFAALCRAPFLEIARPLFDGPPLSDQPAIVADMGCGDGLVLETLYAAVRDTTARGRSLADFPLLMVGADPSPVARRVCAARLTAAGIPHLVVDGDIADPDGFARALGVAGLDARNALHICKSAIHDRAFCWRPSPAGAGPAGAGPVGAGPVGAEPAPECSGAYALPDGGAIPATALAADLAGLFGRWRELTRRHGWLVIEAQAIPAAKAPGLIGRTLVTALDATQGYSCQYLVEPEVFAWAARSAGLRSRAHRAPASATIGHAALTIDHFVPMERRTGD